MFPPQFYTSETRNKHQNYEAIIQCNGMNQVTEHTENTDPAVHADMLLK